MHIARKIEYISILIVLDQVTKAFASNLFKESVEVLPFFHLQFVQNDGIAFSMPFPRLILLLLTITILVFIAWMLLKKKLSKLETLSFIFIFAGGIGNLTDRIFLGAVGDFIKFWDFPIFNLADSFITVGVLLFLISEVLKWRK